MRHIAGQGFDDALVGQSFHVSSISLVEAHILIPKPQGLEFQSQVTTSNHQLNYFDNLEGGRQEWKRAGACKTA